MSGVESLPISTKQAGVFMSTITKWFFPIYHSGSLTCRSELFAGLQCYRLVPKVPGQEHHLREVVIYSCENLLAIVLVFCFNFIFHESWSQLFQREA